MFNRNKIDIVISLLPNQKALYKYVPHVSEQSCLFTLDAVFSAIWEMKHF